MIAYIKGALAGINAANVIIENNGIGYSLSCSMNTIDELPAIGQDIKLFTKLVPKEDSLTLYGFYDTDEMAMFDLLLTVSGIGPKGALAILSSMTPEDIRFAVAGSDSKAFAKVPGIGKKTAERVIVDLKDKVDVVAAYNDKLESGASRPSKAKTSSAREEVLETLVALGYSASVAAKALEKMTITETTDAEVLLNDTLKQMSFL